MRASARRWWLVVAVLFAGCGGGLELEWPSTPEPVVAAAGGSGTAPAVATLPGGDFVVAWSSLDGGAATVRLQRFHRDGTRVGGAQVVNRVTPTRNARPAIAALVDGGYVVAWSSPGGAALDVQRFDAADRRVGGERRVDSIGLGTAGEFGLSARADGGYVLAWVGFDGFVASRRFDASDTPDAQVHVDAQAVARSAFVAGLGDGGHVVAWSRLRQDGSGLADVLARRFDRGGAQVGEPVAVASAAAQDVAGIAALSSGGYAVVWTALSGQSWSGYGAGVDVHAQCLDAAGARRVAQTLVNVTAGWRHSLPAITGLRDGGYLVAWQALNDPAGDWELDGQRFDAQGRRSGSPLRLVDTPANELQPALAAADVGGYVLAWASFADGSGGGLVELQRFGEDDRPQ